MLYKEWLNEWLELYVKASTKERAYVKYRRQTEKYILPVLGNYETEELSAVELQRFSVTLTEMGLSANTVNGILFILRSSLSKAVALGIVQRQYSDAIVRPKARGKKVICFSRDEQKKIEKFVWENNTSYLIGILLSLYTGLRIGELLALTWEDVDFQARTLTIAKSCYDSWQNGRYVKVFDTTKTQSSERVIPLPAQLLVPLKKLRKQTGERFVVAARSSYGAQIRTYQRTFGLVLCKLHIEHRGFHALRHTFATRALEVGMDIKTLSEILGHQNPTVTLQRYAHTFMDHKTEMMNKVGKLLD